MKDPRAGPPLIAALNDPDRLVRCSVAAALGELKDPRAVAPLHAAMNDPDLFVQGRAAKALNRFTTPPQSLLGGLYGSPNWFLLSLFLSLTALGLTTWSTVNVFRTGRP